MPIRGLSNQWKTREGLLEKFASDGASMEWRKVRELLESLDARSSPVIYVGTSHGQMNFCNRDVVGDHDLVQPFALVDVVRSNAFPTTYCFRVTTRTIDGNRPTTQWVQQDLLECEKVIDLILDAFAYAEVPPRQIRG